MTAVQEADGMTIDLDETVPTVARAWSAVMGDAVALSKNQRNTQQNFKFRGIDDVMNLVGPILRQHGVSIIPAVETVDSRDFTTKSGTLMHEVHVTVQYTIIGPAGDFMTGSAAGESADAGDKATPKAMSVAYRTFLLQALCLPTDEPDPDSQTTERSVTKTDAQYAQETADRLATQRSVQIVEGVYKWCEEKGILDEQVKVGPDGMPLSRVFEQTFQRLGVQSEEDAAAEQRIKDGLGAQELTDPVIAKQAEGLTDDKSEEQA